MLRAILSSVDVLSFMCKTWPFISCFVPFFSFLFYTACRVSMGKITLNVCLSSTALRRRSRIVSFTASILDRITGSRTFSRGSLAVRSSWLSEARTVAIVRVAGLTVVKTYRSGEWMTCDPDNARTSITVTVL